MPAGRRVTRRVPDGTDGAGGTVGGTAPVHAATNAATASVHAHLETRRPMRLNLFRLISQPVDAGTASLVSSRSGRVASSTMSEPVAIDVRPLTTERFPELAALFEEGGDPKWCWCTYFRFRGRDWSIRRLPAIAPS